MWLTHRLLSAGLASDLGEGFQSSAGPAQAAFLSPRRGSPAARPSQDLGNAVAGTAESFPSLLWLHTQRVSAVP